MRTALILVVLAALSAAAFLLIERQLTRTWFAVGVHPEVIAAVERARDDQKQLARLDPANAADYHARFAAEQRLLERLRVLAYSRQQLVRRYEIALLVGVLLTAALFGSAQAWSRARQERRLQVLQGALGALAGGTPDVQVADRGRDVLGRIARMVEEASRQMGRDRRRLASLEHLSAWQEAARRHAHEMRTPLTAARLELARVETLASRIDDDPGAELRQLAGSVGEEIERIAAFASRLTAFARVQRPSPRPLDLVALVREFSVAFDGAWPELRLAVDAKAGSTAAMADAAMLRQVLANLAENAARALREVGARGLLTMTPAAQPPWATLEVRDDGPGIADDVRQRIFEPYTTTRPPGEGMGLGLAIARKILLEHGGDLELLRSSPTGTVFRIVLPLGAGEGS